MPRVEGLGFVLHSSGQNANEYQNILNGITTSAGNLDEAMQVVSQTGFFQMKQAFLTLKNAAQSFYPVITFVLQKFTELGEISKIAQTFILSMIAMQAAAFLGFAPSIQSLVKWMAFLVSWIWKWVTGQTASTISTEMQTQAMNRNRASGVANLQDQIFTGTSQQRKCSGCASTSI